MIAPAIKATLLCVLLPARLAVALMVDIILLVKGNGHFYRNVKQGFQRGKRRSRYLRYLFLLFSL